jgi:dihydrofolate reductase
MRKVCYHCAISMDGFVARKDGSFDCFAMEGPHVAEFIETLPSYGVAVMGRKTYEVGLKVGVTNPYPFLKTYVFSRTMNESPDPNVILVKDGAVELIRSLKHEDGKDIWVVGAGDFASTLFAAELIDEITLKVNPLLLGDGIPVVTRLEKPPSLKLVRSKIYDNGIVLLAYETKR